MELQTAFPTSSIPSKHAGSIKFDVKRLQKTLFLCRDCWRIGINLIVAILKHKRNKKFDFQYKINFFSLMNTKSNVFTRGSATRENTTFGVHSVKQKSTLHRKSQISSIYSQQWIQCISEADKKGIVYSEKISYFFTSYEYDLYFSL